MLPSLRERLGVACVVVISLGLTVQDARSAEPAAIEPVEPVLEHAEVDLRALRSGRILTSAAWMAPAANHIGHLGMAPLLEQDEAPPELYGTAAFLGVSTVGMLVLPTMVDVQAQRSRRRIEAQGAPVRQVSLPVVTALLSAVPVVLRGIPVAGEDAGPGRVTVTYVSYAAILALPVRQMFLNHRARVRAGWVEAK